MTRSIDNRVNERDWHWTLATRNASWDRIVYSSVTYGTILFHRSQLWSQLASSSATVFFSLCATLVSSSKFVFCQGSSFFFHYKVTLLHEL